MPAMVRNFYDLLNVPSTATFEELKRNYKLLILQCHPDKLQQQLQQSETKPDSNRNDVPDKQDDNAVAVNLCFSACTITSTDPNVMMPTTAASANIRKKFVAINEAWNTLKDPIKRKLYDAELLQSKFQTHSNIYDTITYKDMRREEIEEEIAAEDDTTEVEVAENYIDENHVESALSAAAADADNEIVGACDAAAGTKPSSTTTTTFYYVYDCRCGGQYELDESAFEALRRSRTHKDNKCRRHHHNQQQQRQQQQEEPQKAENLHQQTQSTSVKLTAAAAAADNDNVDGVGDVDYIDNSKGEVAGNNDDDVDDNDDVIVECSECSLLTTTARCLRNSRHSLLPARPHKRPLVKMASTGDIWLQWFSCCFHQPQSPSRRRHQHQRLRIDRSMIGNPTNFVHTGHIGSADVELSTNHLNAISTQMQSKGGYEMNSIRLHAC